MRRIATSCFASSPKLGIDEIAPPDGAFYIYMDVSHLTHDSLAFCRKLLVDTGIAATPGVDFDPLRGSRTMRFSYSGSTETVEEALRALKVWLPEQARP